MFDLVVAVLAGIVLAVPALIIALAIKLDSKGPVLFGQVRVGREGVPFTLLKFRTMRLRDEAGPLITIGDDARVTRVGRALRARRIDEWPQLLNVLAGHMSFVGPRPEVPRYVAEYPAELRAKILSVRPGITDPAALHFRDEHDRLASAVNPEATYLNEILPEKIAMQAAYVASRNFYRDLIVLIRTAGVMVGLR